LAASRAVARPIPLDAPTITMVCWWIGLRRMRAAMGNSFSAFTLSDLPPFQIDAAFITRDAKMANMIPNCAHSLLQIREFTHRFPDMQRARALLCDF
jgi:hypothetical protein